MNLNFTKKKHIVDPQTEWLKKDLKEFFMDTLNSNSFKNLYYFNYKKIKFHYEKFIKGEIPTSFNLFQIFSAYYFLKHLKMNNLLKQYFSQKALVGVVGLETKAYLKF